MRIRTIIVDDEPLARDKLRGFLQGEDDVEIVAECGDGKSAVTEIEKLRPDLVFLDVQMPELDGFEVIESLDLDPLPKIVFTTAYDRYALKAFEVHALDYLLKPFDRERFNEALELVRDAIAHRKIDGMRDQLMALLEDLDRKRSRYRDRLVIKSSGRVVFLKVADIDWVDAAGNYVKLHAKGESHLLRETMNRLERKLDPNLFLRIHRSTIVNLERIKELQQQFHGDYLVILKNGQRLTLSRSYREKLQQLLGKNL
ncbi:MAG: DNA-binding response regulator [Acidobacteria bacterium]|nr:MAG: DNA-binding response regulator [Acidobacteriota bacterium]